MSNDKVQTPLSSWPQKIWLQHGAESPGVPAYQGELGITWCHEAMSSNDVEYVRADVLAALERDVTGARFAARMHLETVQAQARVIAGMQPAAPALLALVPDGWQLVPIKPTKEMLMAAHARACDGTTPMQFKTWDAMIAAAPSAPQAVAVPDRNAALDEVLKIISAHQVSVGNSAAGELACEWTMDAIKEIHSQVSALKQAPQPIAAPADPVDVCAEMRALCSACGGTGDVHRADGEWLGQCNCAASQQPVPALSAGQTDISAQLREYAGNPGYSHNDYADTMIYAANEIERHLGVILSYQSAQLVQQRATLSDEQIIEIAKKTGSAQASKTGGYFLPISFARAILAAAGAA